MKRSIKSLVLMGALAGIGVVGSATAASAATCTPVATSRGNFTAAVVDTPVTGDLDATGCDIGAYYSTGTTSTVTDATVHNALWYGVFNDGGNVTISNSRITNIGDQPHNGVQRGIGVIFDKGARGSIAGSTIDNYQKGGVVLSAANGAGTYADVLNNVVTGVGPVDYIAQNGVQVSSGAQATVRGNTISGNDYTPKSFVSCGLLYVDADGVKASQNTFRNNESNNCNVGKGGGNPSLAQ